MKEDVIKDALYYCHPGTGTTDEMRKGVIRGLVCGLMASGLTFQETIKLMYRLSGRIIDLKREHVEQHLPEPWIAEWEKHCS